MDENPYQAPRSVGNVRTNAAISRPWWDSFRFLTAVALTVCAAIACFGFVVAIMATILGTEWGREYPALIALTCALAAAALLTLARAIVPLVMDDVRKLVERVLLSASVICAIGYLIIEMVSGG